MWVRQSCVSFSDGLDMLKIAVCLGYASGRVEARGVGGKHGGVSVVVGGHFSVGGAIQRLEVSE